MAMTAGARPWLANVTRSDKKDKDKELGEEGDLELKVQELQGCASAVRTLRAPAGATSLEFLHQRLLVTL